MQKSIIAMLLLTSAAAFANESGDEQLNRASFQGERTRAEVKAEIQKARAAGTLSYSDFAGNLPQAADSFTRSKSEVRAEAVQSARTRIIHELI